ncbi:MAG: TolC family protein [Bryobacteraceae bacterium]
MNAFLRLSVFVATVPLVGQDMLSIDEAVRRALANHPLLAAQTERIAAAGGFVQQARLRPNPTIYLQSENWSITGADPIHTSVNSDQFGYFMQTIETGNKRQRRVEASQQVKKLTELEKELLEKQIGFRVKQAYWAAVGAERVRQLWVEQQENFRQTIEYHEVRVNEGAIAESELLRVRLEADRFSVAAAAAELEAERSRIYLLKEMGEFEIRPITLITPLEMAPVPLIPDLAIALEQRAEAKIARQGIEVAAANLKVQRSLARPNIDAGFGFKRNLGYSTMLFTTQFGLPINDKNQGNIQAALSEEKAARASLLAAESVVRAELRTAERELESRRSQLQNLLATSRQRATESATIANAAYREGGADLLRLLDAQRVRIDLEVLNATTLMEYRQSIVALETAMGVNP